MDFVARSLLNYNDTTLNYHFLFAVVHQELHRKSQKVQSYFLNEHLLR